MAEYPFRPSPPKSDAEYRNEAEMKLLGTEPLIEYLRRGFDKLEAAHVERARQITDVWTASAARESEADVMTEHEYLYGVPHPAVVDHTAAVVERVQALTPPSLVKLDAGEAALAAIVAWRNLELGGQEPGDYQWNDALDYARIKIDRYIEATP